MPAPGSPLFRGAHSPDDTRIEEWPTAGNLAAAGRSAGRAR
jgi:hypothetical protein